MNMTETFELLPPSALIPNHTNARVHTERQLRYLRGSLREFGFVSPVVVDAKNNIIAGHAMVEVAIAENFALVPCVRAEHLTDTQRRAYRIAHNRLAELSSWDTELLQVNLQDLFEDGFDLSITGFGEYKLADVLAKERAPVTETAAKQPERVQAGDLWRLGDHRLLCGDATRGADMARLMRGERAHLLLTDPPYNVNYTGNTDDKLTILNDKMPEGQFQAFLTDAFVQARQVMREGASFYIWHADAHRESFLAAESYGRKCRAMELSPRHCDVIVSRWEAQTGQTATKPEGGERDGRRTTTA